MKIQSSELFFQKIYKNMTYFPKYGVFNFTIYNYQKNISNHIDESALPSQFISQTSILQLRQTGQWIHSGSTMGTPGGENPRVGKKTVGLQDIHPILSKYGIFNHIWLIAYGKLR